MTRLSDILDGRRVHTVFQPIVDLATAAVVGYEALTRGPVGELATPDRLFAAARAEGVVSELDQLCQHVALTQAAALGLTAPLTLFVNAEPDGLDSSSVHDLTTGVASIANGLPVVVELTERALGSDPAAVLATVDRLRAAGCGVALDDVGADPVSLAFMSLLRPDVVKLDLRLVQSRPNREVAQLMNAVNAYAERTGAAILAEGIETDQHLTLARALGASLGQGWLFGHPTSHPRSVAATSPLPPMPPWPAHQPLPVTPFECLPAATALRRSPKELLVEVSKHLERDALRLGPSAVVATTIQQSARFTPATAVRYQQLVDSAGFVCVLGEGLTPWPVPGLRGVHTPPGDPLNAEWDLVVLDPHFAVALLARDLGDEGPDLARMFEFALTYDRPTVERAAQTLIARLTPSPPRTPRPTRVISHQDHRPDRSSSDPPNSPSGLRLIAAPGDADRAATR